PAVATHHGYLVLPHHLDGFDLTPYLAYWYDPDPASTLESAQVSLQNESFTPMMDRSHNLGFARGHHWFHMELQNTHTASRTVLVEVDYPILDRLEFYCFGPSRKPTYFPAGDHLQFDSRVVKVRNYVVPLQLESQGRTECLIRVRSQSNVVLPIRAYDIFPYIEKSQRVVWGLGLLYGLALALLVYNGIIYLSSREPLLLCFISHVLRAL